MKQNIQKRLFFAGILVSSILATLIFVAACTIIYPPENSEIVVRQAENK